MSDLIKAIRRLQPKNLVPYRPKRNPEKDKARSAATRLLRKQQAIALLGGRCVDCGEPFIDHPEVFDFDHARGTKQFNIGQLFQSSWTKLAKELKKCDLVCSNCHRIRTASRAEWPIAKLGKRV